MKNRSLSLLIAWAFTAVGGACSPQSPTPDASPAVEPSAAEPTSREELLIYDETDNGIPVVAQYPDTMRVMGAGSGEGVGIFFTFEPQGNALDDAEVHIFLPSGTASAAALESFVTGPNGLMANNGWIQEGVEEEGSTRFPYSWVEKVIDFSTEMEQAGHILLGQAHAQAIQVTLLYPAELEDQYRPAATSVLETLQFDGDLLPIGAPNL